MSPCARSALLIAFAGGCGTEVQPIALPAEFELGIVASMIGELVKSSSSLGTLSSPIELEIEEGSWISVSSWSRADLGRSARFIDTGTSFSQILACAPRLPPPRAHFALSLDGSRREESVPPRFGRSELEQDCPTRDLAVKLTCGPDPLFCPIAFEGTSCVQDVDLSRCRADGLSIVLDPLGGLCLAENARCRVLDEYGEGLLLDCSLVEGVECNVEIRARPPPAFEILERKILDGSAAPPLDALRSADPIPRTTLALGRLRDLAVSGDTVMVSVSDQPTAGGTCGGQAAKLVSLDRETLEIRSETACPCADRVLPYKDGFVTVRWESTLVVVNTRDRLGTITSTPTILKGSDMRAGDVDVEGDELALTVQLSVDPGDLRARVLRLDLTEPAEQRSKLVPQRALRGVEMVGDTTFVVDDYGDALLYFDELLEQFDEVATLPSNGGRDSATVVASGAYLVVLTEADFPAVHIISDREDIRRSAFHEVQGDASSVLPLGETALIGGVSRYGLDRRGYVSEIDVPTGTFLLGATEVGTGPVTRLVADGEGGAFAMLPWEGSIVHVKRAR
ncbi:MAG: hypothetical protein HY791_15170 [Deltaproteobacteria bacterium]|nr:hypothetical protein [Deltaproteobacteria bacterium]